MKGQVTAIAVAAAASKPLHKTLLVWPLRQQEWEPWHGAWDATGQLLLTQMTASSEQGFSVPTMSLHTPPGLWNS